MRPIFIDLKAPDGTTQVVVNLNQIVSIQPLSDSEKQFMPLWARTGIVFQGGYTIGVGYELMDLKRFIEAAIGPVY